MKKGKVEYGFSSLTDDDKHILLWDFDIGKEHIDKVYQALKKVQDRNKLSDIVLIESRNGYNAICLDKFDVDTAFLIKSETELSDAQHNRIGRKRNGWVLRVGADKVVRDVIISNYDCFHSKSNAHRKLLHKVYGVYCPLDNSCDLGTHLVAEAYIRKKKNEVVK